MKIELPREGAVRTPIAFFIFNRPDLTARVFEAIRAARPTRLFVIADGPRNEAERTLCDAARALIKVDWPCELSTDYAQANLGCGPRVSSGIDRVFAQVEEAIILEDDCLPSRSFFPYCDALLERWRADERVMCVSGMNLFPRSAVRGSEGYYFVQYGATNGWATWRRAWKHFDFRMSAWPDFRRDDRIKDVFGTFRERWFWSLLFEKQHQLKINTWDYQWLFARLIRGGLTAVPDRNMVMNLGFRADATHTFDMPKEWEPAKERHELWSFEHAEYVLPRSEVDRHYFDNIVARHALLGMATQHVKQLLANVRTSR